MRSILLKNRKMAFVQIFFNCISTIVRFFFRACNKMWLKVPDTLGKLESDFDRLPKFTDNSVHWKKFKWKRKCRGRARLQEWWPHLCWGTFPLLDLVQAMWSWPAARVVHELLSLLLLFQPRSRRTTSTNALFSILVDALKGKMKCKGSNNSILGNN